MFNRGWRCFKKGGLTRKGYRKNRGGCDIQRNYFIKYNINYLKLTEPNISLSLEHLIEH